MKLTCILIIVQLLQVSAKTIAQKVSLNEKNTPLIDVFDKISNQTGYDFVFTAQTLKNTRPVSIKVKDLELLIVLNQLFNEQPITYQIKNKIIVVSDNPLVAPTAKKIVLDGNLSGRITDSTGKPIFGATVRLSGNPGGIASTNELGRYSINQIAAGTYMVTASYLGYKTVSKSVNIANEIGVTTNATVNFVLEPVVSKLNEVVVSTGYQTLPKERATGSFEVINNALFNRTVSPNLLDHIQDVVAGVQFTPFPTRPIWRLLHFVSAGCPGF